MVRDRVTYCDGCVSFECPQQAEACGGNPECRAIEACIARCPTANGDDKMKQTKHDCVTKCSAKHPKGSAAFKHVNACMGTCTEQCRSAIPIVWDEVDNTSYLALAQCTLITP